ncbi:hypothetical protein BO97DRAFT_343166, partial [Aspergillus homomorphus CBS 101889]
ICLAHTTTGCGKQGFPSAQPYLSHTPGANPFCCMFLLIYDYKLVPRICRNKAAAVVMRTHSGVRRACMSRDQSGAGRHPISFRIRVK